MTLINFQGNPKLFVFLQCSSFFHGVVHVDPCSGGAEQPLFRKAYHHHHQTWHTRAQTGFHHKAFIACQVWMDGWMEEKRL